MYKTTLSYLLVLLFCGSLFIVSACSSGSLGTEVETAKAEGAAAKAEGAAAKAEGAAAKAEQKEEAPEEEKVPEEKRNFFEGLLRNFEEFRRWLTDYVA